MRRPSRHIRTNEQKQEVDAVLTVEGLGFYSFFAKFFTTILLAFDVYKKRILRFLICFPLRKLKSGMQSKSMSRL